MIAGPLDVVTRLAEDLPLADIERLATALNDGKSALMLLRASSPTPLASACNALLAHVNGNEHWLAGALLGASAALGRAAARQRIDVVWTGPESEIDTSRLTASVVADLIAGAVEELLLASFATTHDHRITAALSAAVDRAVDVTLLLERPTDNPGFTGAEHAFPGVRARRLVWTEGSRPAGAALHAKFVVVDCTTALVGSANLTGRAMEDNLECGILLRGGPQPRAIRDHVWSLRYAGVLRPASDLG